METIINNNTSWGVEADRINRNFAKTSGVARYNDLMAKVMSDEDDIYAHESHFIVFRVDNTSFLALIYASNKTAGEGQTNGTIILKIFELSTLKLLRQEDIFIADTAYWIAPKVQYLSSPILRCLVGTDSGLWARDITIVGTDTTDWTIAASYLMEMTMKDAGGNNVTVDVTAANIQTHLEYTLGDTYSGYNNLIPILRNFDKPISYGGNLYALLELNGEFTSTGIITVIVVSADAGATWTISHLVNYTKTARNTYLESSLVLIGTSFYVLSRTGSGSNTLLITANAGSTWTASTVPITTLSTKPCAINYYNPAKTLGVIFAVNETSEVVGSTGRTTLVIYSTTDFVTLIELTRIVTPSYAHYPSLYYYSNSLYVSYTKGLKMNTDTSNPTSYDRNTVVLTKII